MSKTATPGSAVNEKLFNHALTANETTTLKAKTKTRDTCTRRGTAKAPATMDAI
jgi:hypothetical protein